MGVNPKWLRKIGDGDVSKLFHMHTNMRFGCVILRHFLDNQQGEKAQGLSEYFDDNLTSSPDLNAQEKFLASVLANAPHWEFRP